jgi:hypothetical protein
MAKLMFLSASGLPDGNRRNFPVYSLMGREFEQEPMENMAEILFFSAGGLPDGNHRKFPVYSLMRIRTGANGKHGRNSFFSASGLPDGNSRKFPVYSLMRREFQ